ncbi:MAG: hypothetical protein PHN75_03690 [Syntrophales bacterium]|nr:hypothetical protein [Syntrophales bacterium]
MAISGKYGKLDIPKIAADEPVFILRAQDILAAPVIQIYQVLVNSHGHRPLAAGLDKEIQTFQKWSGVKKMPD